MRDYSHLEHMDMGVPRKIVKGMREHNGTQPDLIEEDERFLVRLWRRRGGCVGECVEFPEHVGAAFYAEDGLPGGGAAFFFAFAGLGVEHGLARTDGFRGDLDQFVGRRPFQRGVKR